MAHPLYGAFKRVDRADVHIQQLKTLVYGFAKAHEDKLLSEKNATDPHEFRLKPGQKMVVSIQDRTIGISEDIPILAGEIIYNLRAALDYLVYELAVKDSGSPKSGTQFLIEDNKNTFNSRAINCLNGLSIAHIEGIEALQPYVGCTWAKTLRDISNPDKHRHLTGVSGRWKRTIIVNGHVEVSLENDPGEIGVPYPESHLDLQRLVNVTFPDGTPVIEVLQFVKSSVAGVLKIFESDF